MASLRFRNGKWQVQVRRFGHASRTQTFYLKADARRWARQIEIEFDRTLLPYDSRTLNGVTIADLLRRYRDTVTPSKRGRVPEAQRVEVMLRNDWTRLSVARATASVFSCFRNARLREVQPSTVRREMNLLSSIFELARTEWGYTALQNPMAGIKKPKEPEGRNRRLRVGEFDALIEACRNKASGFWLERGIRLAIETGLRRGELLGIRWKHVNFNLGLLHVPITKTDKARTIPLTDQAVLILRELRATSTTGESVFEASTNGFRLAWERCKRRAEKAGCAGIYDLRFHDLRHEAISRFFEIGLNTAEVALISGHRDVRMLFRYTHLKAEDVGIKLRAATIGKPAN